MGDFSSTFTIRNQTSRDFFFHEPTDIELSSGYLLRFTQKLPAGRTSDAFQIKDKFGLYGTEAKVSFRERPGGQGPVAFQVHLICPLSGTNDVGVPQHQRDLLVTVTPFTQGGHPLIVEFLVNNA